MRSENDCDRTGAAPGGAAARFAARLLAAAMLLLASVSAAPAQLRIGEDPVFQYARDGDIGAVRYFLHKGTNVDVAGAGGETLLIIAASRGYAELVEVLVKAGARVDRTDDFGRTALSLAADQGHYAVIERLVESGADINHQTRDGLTPLMGAVRHKHLAVVQLLLKHRPDLGLLDYTGRSALGWALAARDRRAETMLRRAGAVD